MVELKREPDGAGPVVTGFAAGRLFKVREDIYPSGLWLTPREAGAWDAPALDALDAGELAPLLALHPRPEFLLLGTGANLAQPPRSFVRAIEAQGFGVEVMDSRAAARAWSVLRVEERWIVAALLPI